jgi:hypothetical protein
MDIGGAFSYVFEDEDWIVKILLGAAIMLIPIFGQLALSGYGIAILRNIKAGKPRPLPAWNNLGDFFMDGLMFWVVRLVYGIPIFVLLCPIIVVSVLPVLGAENEDLLAILAGISGVVAIGVSCLIVLYSILLGLLMPVVQIRLADTGEIGACLRFGEMFRFLFSNIGPVILTQLVIWAASVILMSIAGTLSLGLLALPIAVFMKAVSGYLYAQINPDPGPLAA